MAGDTDNMQQPDQQQPEPSDTLLVQSDTAAPDTPRKVIGRPFPPGVSGNPAGRPKRGQTYLDRLRAERDRNADKIAEHQVQQAMRERTPRFATFLRDTLDGLPKQVLSIEREETPGDLLLQRVNRRLAELAGQTVDADGVTVLEPEQAAAQPHDIT